MTTGDGELLFKDEVHAIVGAAMKLHTELGNGFLEAVYQKGLALAFRKFGIPFEAQKELRIELWGEKLGKTYFADFVCFGKIIEKYAPVSLGHKISGAGGSGYLVLVSETPIKNAQQVRIRR